MPLTFYYHQFSPPSRAVWMTLEALGIEYVERLVDLFKGEQYEEFYEKINPNNAVPAITNDEDDISLAESRAVAGYLVNKYGENQGKKSLYPSEPKVRARVDQQLYADEEYYKKIISFVNPGGLFHGECHLEKNIPEVKKALASYERQLTKYTYVADNNLTIADFFALQAIKSAVTADFDNFAEYPNILRWLKLMEALPYYEKTSGKPVADQTELFRGMVAKNKAEKK